MKMGWLCRMIVVSWLLLGLFAQPVLASPAAQEVAPTTTVDVTLTPATLLGDVYVDGALVAARVNVVSLPVTPAVAHLIEVKAITDSTPGFGDIFVYADVSQGNVVVAEGRARALALRPSMTYLKGYLSFTCDIRGQEVGQEVLCQVNEGEVPLATVTPGQTAQVALPVGTHAIRVAVVGAHADLWAPPFNEHTVTIVGGRTAPLRSTFNRKGQVAMSFNVEGVVGDFYVDEQLVAAQVPAASLFVAPGSHTVAGRNLVDPAANGVYRYPDVSSPTTVAANQTRAAVLRLQKEYLLGFGEVTCRINGVEAGHDVRCNVAVDGQPLGTIEVGQMQSYNLTPGPHTATVAVIGANADLWAPLSQELPLTIVAGRASRLTPTFNRKGQVAMSFNVEGLVGDFYVDEQLVAAQVPAASLFVAPGNHAVAGRNLVDPAANGVYRYLDISSPATVAANQTRAVVLRPQKEYLLGFGEVACRINGVEAGHDVRCNVVVDGQPLGTVEVGQTQSYNLVPGPHTATVAVVGANADLWAPLSQDLPLTIVAGRASRLTPTFNRRGILAITLSDPNVVADIYVDGAVIAGQVNTAQSVVEPGVRHTVEALNLRNVTAPDAFEYDPITTSAVAGANQTSAVRLAVGRPRERCTGSMALVRVTNRLSSALTVQMAGPESKTVYIPFGGEAFICVLPGSYQLTNRASGYYTYTSTRDFGTGGCHSYQLQDLSDFTQPPGCSTNAGDYHRP